MHAALFSLLFPLQLNTFINMGGEKSVAISMCVHMLYIYVVAESQWIFAFQFLEGVQASFSFFGM